MVKGEIDAILLELVDLVRHKDAEVVPLLHATPRALQNALREAATKGQPFHILHFIGHGTRDSATGQALLFFEDGQGRAQPLGPAALADLLRPFDLKLVYLNGCETAALSSFDLTQGFAPALMAAGTPAVIGLQVAVWDRVARQVAQDFYAALADNQPVDQALLSARQLAGSEPLQEASMAFPVCYLRTASGQIVSLVRPGAPRLGRATWRAWLKLQATPKRLAQGFVALVGLVSALLGIYLGIEELRSNATPPPLPAMSGRFNIAVAALSELDSQGRARESTIGKQLAQEVAAQIEPEVKGLQEAGYRIDLYGPDKVQFVRGASDDERARNAAELAEGLKADLLLYGHLVLTEDSTGLTPYLSVSSNHFTNATELTGAFPFGEPIQVADNIEKNVPASKQMEDDLARRTGSLAEFVVGLGYYKLNQLSEAAQWFEKARRDSGDDAKIRRVVLLFLGSTAARRADLQEANFYYSQALHEDPSYARARLGQAQMVFQRARGRCSPDTVDAQGLEEAIAGYQEARAMFSLPADEIMTKAAFSLGQAYLCQALAGDGERWDMAQVHLQGVVDRYQIDKDLRVKPLAAEALFHLGMLHSEKSKYLGVDNSELARAAETFQQAIALSGLDDRKATFGYWLAQTHGKMAQCVQARQDLAGADAALDRFASANPDAAVQKERDFRQEVLHELAVSCPSSSQ